VARHKAARLPGSAAEGELAGYERAAVAAGDAERLAAVRSWRALLRECGGDAAVARLFATFAQEDQHGAA